MDIFDYIDKMEQPGIADINMDDGIMTSKILDIFPCCISDENKFNQANIYFQKALEDKSLMATFMQQESKFLESLICLWLYNDMYAVVCPHTENLNSNYLAKHSKKELQAFTKSSISPYQIFKINDLELLKSVVSIGARGIGIIHLFLSNKKTVITLADLCGVIKQYQNNDDNFFESWFSNFGLFVRNDGQNNTADNSVC